jgi:hypothetical protein
VCVCADFEIRVLEPDVKSKNRSGLSDENKSKFKHNMYIKELVSEFIFGSKSSSI